MFEDFISTVDIHLSYTFKETLGQQKKYKLRGAFAEVKKAIYIEEQKAVAIKCIDKQRINAEDLKIYKNQCQIMLRLEHPNIIQVYQVYDNPEFFYIVMEYMEGGELCDTRNTHRCKTQAQICQIVKTLTDALDFCHSKGIVHRDIKPENILWSTSNQDAILKIADFGFAKLSSDSLMTTACGTPMYFSPEIISGQPYGRSVDFWSLGVITYILLSGKSPFQSENQTEDENILFQRIKSGKINIKDGCWKYISTSAKDLISRLLEKNPDKRLKADEIRNHPWITSQHKQSYEYNDRELNLQNFDANRKIQKIRAIINITLDEIKNESIMEHEDQSGSY